MIRLVASLLLGLFALDAYAYIGPGLGLGAIGVVLGVLASLVLAVIGLFWYPLKRLFKRKKLLDESQKQDEQEQDQADAAMATAREAQADSETMR